MSKIITQKIYDKSWNEVEKEWNDVFNSFFYNRIFQSPKVKKIWWKYFGKGNQYKILVITYSNNKLISPLRVQGKTCSFIGSTDLFDYEDLIYSNYQDMDLGLEKLVNFISNDLFVEELRLNSIPDNSPTIKKILKYLEQNNWQVDLKKEDVSPRISLPSTFDEYLFSLSKKNRHEIRRKIRKLDKIKNVKEYEFFKYQDIKDNLDDFFRLLRISSDEKKEFMNLSRENFFRDLSLELSLQNQTRLRFLEIGNKRVATSLSFVTKGTKYLYNSGYDPEYRDLSVGVLNHIFAIKNSIYEKNKVFDFMRGDEVYKYRLGGIDETISKLIAHKR
ncbi:MAG: hypothetical protein CL780_05705 [Chloroflexi bacterium]|nr:hypothetical protein [Chloroflexota bacterium]|tara:strand:+ start:3803 stop:4798 length:996 start_codon:yes stop_codon:yes gene_type:complete